MNKKGFTLIEIMGVVVLISLVFLLVFPTILNKIKNAQESIDKNTEKIIISSAKDYINDNKDKVENDFICLNISDLVDYGYISENIINVKNKNLISKKIKLIESAGKESFTIDNKCFEEYKIGNCEDKNTYVEYKGEKYCVIENSDEENSYVKLLKYEPLTEEEVKLYGGVGTDDNHVNIYATHKIDQTYYQTVNKQNGYGGMAYYTSFTCGYITSQPITSGCTTDFKKSEMKYVIDKWKKEKELDKVEVRLITYEELNNNLGYIDNKKTEKTPLWLYKSDYWYMTMTQCGDKNSKMWGVDRDGGISEHTVYISSGVVRPVINLPKSKI